MDMNTEEKYFIVNITTGIVMTLEDYFKSMHTSYIANHEDEEDYEDDEERFESIKNWFESDTDYRPCEENGVLYTSHDDDPRPIEWTERYVSLYEDCIDRLKYCYGIK